MSGDMDTPAVDIALEAPRQDEVVRLIRELDAYMDALYPAESNHLLDIDALADPSIRLFVARHDGRAVGCGALRVDASGYGEVKRMFVAPNARGLKIGIRILGRIEQQARVEGLRSLRLETGIRQPEALALYRGASFVERGPFGDYRPDPLSVFMEKSLSGEELSSVWDVELQVAIAAARAGGAAALSLFGKRGPVTWKPDESPVGEADHAADAAIRHCIRASFPDDAILTEESGAHVGKSGRRWIVDPVDGTRDFLRGLPYWANLIALEAGGRIVVGVLHLAALGKLYAAARGGGTWRDGVRLTVRDTANLSRCFLVLGEPDCILSAVDPDAFGRLVRTVGSARGYGAPYGAALLLDGQAAWTEGNVSLWDIAPFGVLFEEAGASFTDLTGSATWPCQSGLASGPALHRGLLDVIRAP